MVCSPTPIPERGARAPCQWGMARSHSTLNRQTVAPRGLKGDAHRDPNKVDATVPTPPVFCKFVRIRGQFRFSVFDHNQMSLTTRFSTTTYAPFEKTLTRPLRSGPGFARLVED